MTRRQKVELTWIGKENRPKLEPRILPEDTGKSYHAKRCVTSSYLFDNRLICGGKPSRYVLIPHDEIAENITLEGLTARFDC